MIARKSFLKGAAANGDRLFLRLRHRGCRPRPTENAAPPAKVGGKRVLTVDDGERQF